MNLESIIYCLTYSYFSSFYFSSDALFRYEFNKDKITFSLPLPLGGKSSEELNIPSEFTIPEMIVPHIGRIIFETTHRIPSFTIPHSLDFSLPQLGVAEVSAKVNSNFYDWESSVSGGNYTVDVPSYIAKYKVMASCPVEPLSYKIEGTFDFLILNPKYTSMAHFENLFNRVTIIFLYLFFLQALPWSTGLPKTNLSTLSMAP